MSEFDHPFKQPLHKPKFHEMPQVETRIHRNPLDIDGRPMRSSSLVIGTSPLGRELLAAGTLVAPHELRPGVGIITRSGYLYWIVRVANSVAASRGDAPNNSPGLIEWNRFGRAISPDYAEEDPRYHAHVVESGRGWLTISQETWSRIRSAHSRQGRWDERAEGDMTFAEAQELADRQIRQGLGVPEEMLGGDYRSRLSPRSALSRRYPPGSLSEPTVQIDNDDDPF